MSTNVGHQAINEVRDRAGLEMDSPADLDARRHQLIAKLAIAPDGQAKTVGTAIQDIGDLDQRKQRSELADQNFCCRHFVNSGRNLRLAESYGSDETYVNIYWKKCFTTLKPLRSSI